MRLYTVLHYTRDKATGRCKFMQVFDRTYQNREDVETAIDGGEVDKICGTHLRVNVCTLLERSVHILC